MWFIARSREWTDYPCGDDLMALCWYGYVMYDVERMFGGATWLDVEEG
jgi:hypothetical protein